MTKNNTVRKYIITILIIAVSVFLVILITGVCLRLIPIKRTFSYVYEGEPFSEVFVIDSEDLPDIMISGSESHPYHYQAICGHRKCYLYSDTKITEGGSINKPSRLMGIVIHSTDNSGIWMKYPVFLYE